MKRLRHPLLSPSLGTQRELVSLHYGDADAGEKAYLQASLHADELPGMLVMHHLMRLLDDAEARGRMRGEVVLVPLANPIGLSQHILHATHGRFELASGENFNRVYPDFLAALGDEIEARLGRDEHANRRTIRDAMRQHLATLAPATELASLRRALSALACDADVVLDLHCDNEAVLHLYCEEPYWPLCEPLARLLGARTVLLGKASGGASFDEAMSGIWWQLDVRLRERSVPIPLACLSVTVELRGEADVDHALAAHDAAALYAFLVRRGIVASAHGDERAAPLPELCCAPTPLAGSETLRAPHPGVIVFVKQPGDEVEAGEVVAEIIDPLERRVTPVLATYPGLLYARVHKRYATRDMAIAKVAGAVAFRSGNLLSP